ncbi:unnamed protein product [Protopolystoma xenopodis]|uniref:Uncharacterized protein n=1 Tax=Protopolystoma xenopodis TaxID=117903 RepID=A0A448XK16_9PLAT|nr:unnamed protein product [Protopolystoma xenopodis]
MDSCSNDVCHGGKDESSAQVHRGRKMVSRGLLGIIEQSSLRGNPAPVSRILSNQLFIRNMRLAGEATICDSLVRQEDGDSSPVVLAIRSSAANWPCQATGPSDSDSLGGRGGPSAECDFDIC